MAVETTQPAIAAELVAQHIDRARDLLAAYRADGLLVFRDTNIRAFCGVPLAPSDRLVCGLLNQGGQVALVAPAFEAHNACTLPPGSELVLWEEHEYPYMAVYKAASMLGLESGTILLDGHTWLDTYERLSAELPAATFRRDPGLIESVRITKSPEEIEVIRAACEDAGQFFSLVAQHLRIGMSELDMNREVTHQFHRDGLSVRNALIQGGETASVPHRPSGTRVFQDGDAVIVDLVCEKESYHGDITRTFALGRPREEIREAYTVVRDAQRAAIASVRRGVTCESIDRAARSVIEHAGLSEYFIHRVGHGIGLDGHEPPYLVQGNRKCLAAGMCVTIEPGVYVPGQFGIRIEDVISVTADGCEILSSSVPTDVSAEFK